MNFARTAKFASALTMGLLICDLSAIAKDAITLGATNSTSSMYSLSVAMGKAIQAEIPGANVSVLETGASIDNIRRMMRKEVDIGLVTLDTAVHAAEGTGPFAGRPVPDLAVVYPFTLSYFNLAVRADSGAQTMKDLAGKKINPGMRGSGTEVLTRRMAEILGLSPVPEWVLGTTADAVEGVQNRQVTGYAKYSAGDRMDATLREIATTTQMRLIGFSSEEQAKLRSQLKGIGFAEMPKETTPDGKPVAVPTVLVTYAAKVENLDDETAYRIAKAIHQNRKFLIDAWPQLESFDFVTHALEVEKQGVKLHPGAKRYWESARN